MLIAKENPERESLEEEAFQIEKKWLDIPLTSLPVEILHAFYTQWVKDVQR